MSERQRMAHYWQIRTRPVVLGAGEVLVEFVPNWAETRTWAAYDSVEQALDAYCILTWSKVTAERRATEPEIPDDVLYVSQLFVDE